MSFPNLVVIITSMSFLDAIEFLFQNSGVKDVLAGTANKIVSAKEKVMLRAHSLIKSAFLHYNGRPTTLRSGLSVRDVPDSLSSISSKESVLRQAVLLVT